MCSNLHQVRRVESIAAAAMQVLGYTSLPSAQDEECHILGRTADVFILSDADVMDNVTLPTIKRSWLKPLG